MEALQPNVYIPKGWAWGNPKTPAQTFFEAYAHSVSSWSFTETITKWYGPSTIFHSETAKVYHGAQEMLEWMKSLFFNFERVDHKPEEYLEIPLGDGKTRIFARFHRQLWLKGNTSDQPDINTPMAFFLTIGPAETADGYLGLQFHELHLFWDKTKTVELLQKKLPSD